MLHSLKDAAEAVGLKPAVLLQWVRAGKVQPTCELNGLGFKNPLFDDAAINRLLKLAEPKDMPSKAKPASHRSAKADNEFYTPKELAELWGLSPASIRKLFEAEPDVVKIGNNSKRKRRYLTMRIPSAVAERVRKRMSA